ncbi:serine hydrolase [Micromonospora arborensis]|uniref:serine hydrolase n=1 Tax=Micromonospora arborensis TaxID=2116518 RepID=UPI00342F0C48
MSVARRTLLGAGLAAAASALTGCGDNGVPGPDAAGPGDAVTATDAAGNRVGFGSAGNTRPPSGAPSATASASGAAVSAGQARYAQDVTALLRKQLPATPQALTHKGFPGAVAVVLVDASSRTFGHTGFAGPSLLVDPNRKLVLALLTNRAHPNWSWSNPDPVRAAVGDLLAREVN